MKSLSRKCLMLPPGAVTARWREELDEKLLLDERLSHDRLCA